jgi:hypothetical protein
MAEESVAARKFFMRRLGQWSAYVIPVAFFVGVVMRNMNDTRRIEVQRDEEKYLQQLNIQAEAKRIFEARQKDKGHP